VSEESQNVFYDRSDPDGVMGTKWSVGEEVSDEFEIVDEVEDIAPPKKEEKPEKPAPKAETKDDDEPSEEELAEYSDKVQRRISKLTKKRREEERLRQAAERRAQEIETRARELEQKYGESQQLIQRGQVALLAKIQRAAELASQDAERKYRDAFERGDSDALIAAQRELYEANAELQQVKQYQGQQAPQTQAQPVQQPTQPQAVPEPDPRAKAWAERNQWFGQDEEATAYAYGLHEKMVRREGYDPTSDEYYEEMESRIKRRFPELFDEPEELEETIVNTPEVDSANQRKQAQNVVAPGGRNNGSAPLKITLTPTMRKTAAQLGISPEDYAKEMLKIQRNQA
jgi:DNA repair exonuclease SbcCD ATPase subunit